VRPESFLFLCSLASCAAWHLDGAKGQLWGIFRIFFSISGICWHFLWHTLLAYMFCLFSCITCSASIAVSNRPPLRFLCQKLPKLGSHTVASISNEVRLSFCSGRSYRRIKGSVTLLDLERPTREKPQNSPEPYASREKRSQQPITVARRYGRHSHGVWKMYHVTKPRS
jgi:hypothetical protein